MDMDSSSQDCSDTGPSLSCTEEHTSNSGPLFSASLLAAKLIVVLGLMMYTAQETVREERL